MPPEEQAKIVWIELSKINFETTGKLREVHSESEAYLDIKRSIASYGFNPVKPILLRHMRDANGKITEALDCRDGHQRGHICNSLFGPDFKIPCVIDDKMTDEEALMWQYRLNTAVPTTIREKATYFKTFATAHPMMTQDEIAECHSVAPAYISKVLRFDKLTPEAVELVDKNKIKTTAALLLCTIPTDFQNEFLKSAMSMPVNEFAEHISGQRSAIREAQRAGRAEIVQVAVPHLLKSDEIKLKFEREKQILEDMDTGHEDYSYQTGRFRVLEEILQIDAESLARIKATREATKETNAVDKARKRKEDADKAFEEIMEKNKAATAAQDTGAEANALV